MGRWQDLVGCLLASCLILGWTASATRVSSRPCYQQPQSGGSDGLTIYNFSLPDLHDTRNVSLSEFRGLFVLVVNVATYWGFTWHYRSLNALKESYNDSDLEILGFPCNQFGKQEPGANGTEIWNGIKYVRPGDGYEPNFAMFKKIDVNGAKEEPLYTYLKSHCPETRDYFSDATKLFYTPMNVRDIRWNFELFLINRKGKPVIRYDSSTDPITIATDLDYLLSLE